MRLLPARKRYRCTVCGATVLLKTERRLRLKQALYLAVGLLLVLLGTWLWLGFQEAADDRFEKRRIELIE